MYSNLIISLLILSHIIGDFYLQNDKIAKEKAYNASVLLRHSLHHFLISLLFTICFLSIKLTAILCVFAFFHYLIDYKKIQMNEGYGRHSLILFFVDQLLHISIIIAAYPFYNSIDLNKLYIGFSNFIVTIYPILKGLSNDIWVQVILTVAFFLFILSGGTVITRLTLSALAPQGEEEAADSFTIEAQNAASPSSTQIEEIAITLDEPKGKSGGEIVGILERILIFTFVLINNYVAITFVITAKSIARFDKITKDKSFSDKFLIGTLTSVSVAIFSAFIYKALFLY